MKSEGLKGIIEFYSNPQNTIAALDTLAKTTLIAEILVPIFAFMSIAYMFFNTWIKESHKGKFWDPAELKRLIIIMILIPIIPALMLFIHQLGYWCTKLVEMDASDKFQSISQLWTQMNSGSEEEFSLWSITFGIAYKLMAMLVMIFSVLFLFVIKFAVLLFCGVFIQFCIIVSPLAMAFSILPIFKDQVEKLLKVFFNVCFVGLTINLLDHLLFNSLFSKIIETLNDPAADLFNYMMISATCGTIIVCYIAAFFLTSIYVGSPGGAALLGTAVTMATMAVMAASKIPVSGGSSSDTSVSSPEANVVKNLAQSIKKTD